MKRKYTPRRTPPRPLGAARSVSYSTTSKAYGCRIGITVSGKGVALHLYSPAHNRYISWRTLYHLLDEFHQEEMAKPVTLAVTPEHS